ncbi:response regulator transcription factor [Gottfriedia endophytica]|uniref:response regulator transcription factor n=1 Tax=Gottfriedia endophytica TaxID=2820819 RepID=UPI003899283C
MVKILLCDDEQRLRRIMVDFLQRESIEVLEAEDGEEALRIYNLHKNEINLILLDVMMPKKDGWEVCKEIRKDSNVPIMMITAKGEEYDELYGFQVGADEYITKPVKPLILIARIKALLKRVSIDNGQSERNCFKAKNIEVDFDARKAFIDNQQVDLTQKEFELLSYFIKNPKIALAREQILSAVWGYEYEGEDRTLDTHINRLRKKLGSCASYVHTIHGMGYRFEEV